MPKYTNNDNKIKPLADKILNECIQRAKQMDPEAIEILRVQYCKMVEGIAKKPYLSDILGKEDSINYAWVLFYEKIQEYEGTDKWGSFITYMQNHIKHGIDHIAFPRIMINNEAYNPTLVSLQQQQEAGLDHGITTNQVDDVEQDILLNQCIDDLPEKYRVIIKLHYFEDLTFEEIGKQLNISCDACRQRSSRAISMLREMMTDDKAA